MNIGFSCLIELQKRRERDRDTDWKFKEEEDFGLEVKGLGGEILAES